MINNIQIRKLDDFIERESSRQSDIVILQETPGSYNMFNKYDIIKEDGSYIVAPRTTHERLVFYALKYAVTYCIFDHKNQIYAASRIKLLDKMIESTGVEIDLHRKMYKTTQDGEVRLIHLSKLSDKEFKKKSLVKEAQNYVLKGRNWQYKDFNKKS